MEADPRWRGACYWRDVRSPRTVLSIGLLGVVMTACTTEAPGSASLEPTKVGTDGGAASDGGATTGSSGPGGGASTGPDGATTVACTGAKHTAGGPDAWGGCWPGPDNTGVPAGTTLTPYTGPCTITAANTVIDAKSIDCDLVIKASNVKITRSKITGSVATDEESTGYSFELSDSFVDRGNEPGTGVGAVNFKATRVHVIGGTRSMHCWHDCEITDSYVHGQLKDDTGTHHESGMRMGQSATFRHNTIVCDAPDVPPDAGCSADLTGYGDFGPVQNNTLEKNLFGASTAGYCTYGGSTQGKPYSSGTNHIVFRDNVWQRGTKPGQGGAFFCGYYGSNTSFDPDLPGNVWSNNTFDDGSEVVSSN